MSYEVPDDVTALGNGKQVSRAPSSKPGYDVVQFATTPPLSSYLFAVVVGKLEHVSGTTADGKDVAVWAVPGKKGWLDFALEVIL